jgi:hypothetical protein
MTKAEEDGRSLFCHSGFAINLSFVIRISSLQSRYAEPAGDSRHL